MSTDVKCRLLQQQQQQDNICTYNAASSLVRSCAPLTLLRWPQHLRHYDKSDVMLLFVHNLLLLCLG